MAKEAARKNKDCWLDYFQSIKSVCPWSLQSYLKGKLDIQPYFDYRPLGEYEARVYIYHLEPHLLSNIMEHMNDQYEDEEWLYSHPKLGQYASPVPCLIQQDHHHLQRIRFKLKSPK